MFVVYYSYFIMKKILLLSFLFFIFTSSYSIGYETYSPDRRIVLSVDYNGALSYSVKHDGKPLIETSRIDLRISGNYQFDSSSVIPTVSNSSVSDSINTLFYRSSLVYDNYNGLLLEYANGWHVEFRVYNDGVAYRLINNSKKKVDLQSELIEYNFPLECYSYIPYVAKGEDGDLESQFFNTFENTYTECKLSEMNPGRLSFLPLLVQTQDGVNVCITESDLYDYPGLYLRYTGSNKLSGIHAKYPKSTKQGGHNMLQKLVTEREDYIAVVDKGQSLPWRIAVISDSDVDIAASELTYLLSSPSKLSDTSWIRPGKVAWEWWNDWNIDGVDFVSGVNNSTYKEYIDFAAENNIEYVILDEGWAVNKEADLFQVVDDINLEELVEYASSKDVGIILWAGYYAFARDMENVCKHYSEMGVKGFKIDFLDRDDQEMISFIHDAAMMCAKYKMVLDIHGTSKPAGLNRTYPNILNFEGVHGMEQMKWSKSSDEQVKYDVTVPYIRQVAGPMDYTQGAMRNATRENYYPCNSEPMSQGTRCRQLALYIIFDSPLNMLCDSPSNYRKEQECTDLISSIPTVWDETRVLEGKIGEYIVMARRKGNTWYICGITDWSKRDLVIDLSFIPDIDRMNAVSYIDGCNAHRIARDYAKKVVKISNDCSYRVSMAPGGGFLLVITK